MEQLICDCVTVDAAARPSAAQVVERLLAIPEGRCKELLLCYQLCSEVIQQIFGR